jgi:hypothetical protein
MVYGFRIYCQRTSSTKNAVTKRKVFWTTLICSIGVIIECAYLLALIISRHNENILSLSMYFIRCGGILGAIWI